MLTFVSPGPALLASVTTPAEAELACAAGASIIDAKNPDAGALGALPVETVTAIRAAVPATIPVSATIGDLALDPGTICRAVAGMSQSGCDLIKIGFFPGGAPRETLTALARLDLGRVKLVGLLLVDLAPDFELMTQMANAGFAGVMLDTAAKSAGTLRTHMDPPGLVGFIDRAHASNLFAGLAGSLRLSEIGPLAALNPDVLGFRGALCEAGDRTGAIAAVRVREVRAAMDRAIAARVGATRSNSAMVSASRRSS